MRVVYPMSVFPNYKGGYGFDYAVDWDDEEVEDLAYAESSLAGLAKGE